MSSFDWKVLTGMKRPPRLKPGPTRKQRLICENDERRRVASESRFTFFFCFAGCFDRRREWQDLSCGRKICSKTTGQIPQTIPHERILVRNERGGYDELTQRLAANTLSTLPTATKQRLGPLLVETTIGIPTSASRMQLMNRSRDDAIEENDGMISSRTMPRGLAR